MSLAAITKQLLRSVIMALEKKSAANQVPAANEGDLNIAALDSGLGQIIVKDEDGTVTYLHGARQDLAQSAKGAIFSIKCTETEIDCSGATSTASSVFPAKCLQLGVVVRVTEAIAGATSFNIGDGSDADRYGATIGLTLGTQTTFASVTADPRGYSASAGNVVLTAVGSDFTDGKVRITAFYMDCVGPTA